MEHIICQITKSGGYTRFSDLYADHSRGSAPRAPLVFCFVLRCVTDWRPWAPGPPCFLFLFSPARPPPSDRPTPHSPRDQKHSALRQLLSREEIAPRRNISVSGAQPHTNHISNARWGKSGYGESLRREVGGGRCVVPRCLAGVAVERDARQLRRCRIRRRVRVLTSERRQTTCSVAPTPTRASRRSHLSTLKSQLSRMSCV